MSKKKKKKLARVELLTNFQQATNDVVEAAVELEYAFKLNRKANTAHNEKFLNATLTSLGFTTRRYNRLKKKVDKHAKGKA